MGDEVTNVEQVPGSEGTTTTPDGELGQEGTSATPKVNPVAPRINELTRKAHESAREAEYWRQRAIANEAPKEAPPEKPTPDKYAEYGDYVEALAEWKAQEKIDKALKERDEKAVQTRQQQERASAWSKSVDAARQRHADYDQVIGASEVFVAQHVMETLQESEEGASLALHLAKNPDIADKLNKMTPRAATLYLGRLEATLAPLTPTESDAGEADNTAPAVKKDEPVVPPAPKVKTTSAPPPTKPIGQGTSTKKSLEKMSMDEYVAERAKQGASWVRNR